RRLAHPGGVWSYLDSRDRADAASRRPAADAVAAGWWPAVPDRRPPAAHRRARVPAAGPRREEPRDDEDAGHRAVSGPRQPGRARAALPEPAAQRARGHARWRHGLDRADAQRGPGDRCSVRHRARHSARVAGARAGAVLHDEAARLRPRPSDLGRHRAGSRRPAAGGEQGGRGPAGALAPLARRAGGVGPGAILIAVGASGEDETSAEFTVPDGFTARELDAVLRHALDRQRLLRELAASRAPAPKAVPAPIVSEEAGWDGGGLARVLRGFPGVLAA